MTTQTSTDDWKPTKNVFNFRDKGGFSLWVNIRGNLNTESAGVFGI